MTCDYELSARRTISYQPIFRENIGKQTSYLRSLKYYTPTSKRKVAKEFSKKNPLVSCFVFFIQSTARIFIETFMWVLFFISSA